MNPKNLLLKTVVVIPVVTFFSGLALADVKPNPLFTDGAVLQRGQVLPVWGTAAEGEKVTLAFGGQRLATTAKNGKWRVDLKPLKEGGPFTMKISGNNTVEIKDLLVGEVWVCSGQSNMEWILSQVDPKKEEQAKANFPKVRMFTVKKNVAVAPLDECEGKWQVCAAETVGGFSAVGYYFARDLHQKLGIPVGMIHTSWGGTPAQAWTSLEGFGDDPELKGYVDAITKKRAGYDAAVAAYKVATEEFSAKAAEWNEAVGKPYDAAMKDWKVAEAEAKTAGKPVPAQPVMSSPKPQAPSDPKGGSSDPANLFNAMVAPIIPYGMKGVIWYQGESNANQAKQYRKLFPAMIADWRGRWKQGSFPFLFVQIAPYNGQPPEIREAQFLTLATVKNTAMAVTTDVGDANDIHPLKKEPVGQRLALGARALAYGEKIEYSGPLYHSMVSKRGKITVNFKHTGTGLVAKDGELKGFTIAGDDKKFVPAKAIIQGNTVVVSSAEVADPKAVRYGWSNVPDVNLFNKENLPASPFRSDVE